MAKINSRAKGARGEREFRDELRKQGYTARRGQQFSGSPDSPDVICEDLPELHFEVKRVESLQLYTAMEQARRDAGEHKTPVLAHKKNGKDWVVVMDLQDWFELLRKAKQHDCNDTKKETPS